jgi:hypothetical protein
MSVMPASAKVWQWPAEVVSFAERFEAASYLEPLRKATLRMFPEAVELSVFLQDDPEVRELTFLVFELQVPRNAVPNFVEAQRRWVAEYLRICPSPRSCPFCFNLLPV